MNAPHKVHLKATKHVLHYIKGIQKFGIFYEARIAMACGELLIWIGLEIVRSKNQHVTYFN
jgi:hypothetical protein